MTRFGALLFALLSASTAAAQGPWPEASGHVFLSPGAYYYHTTRSTDDAGTATRYPNGGRFVGQGFSLYSEVGLSPRWTLHTKALVISNRYQDDAGFDEANGGVGDLELGLRRLLLDGSTKLAARVETVLPLLYDGDDRPSLGYGQYAVQGTLVVGGALAVPANSWWSLEGSYRHYFGDVPEQVRAVGTVGLAAGRSVALLTQVETVLSTGSGAGAGFGANPLAQPGASTLKPAVGLIVGLAPGVRLHAGYFREVLSRNAGLGQGGVVNLWVRLPAR